VIRNRAYLDIATKRQALLERLKTAQANDFNKVFREIERLIRRTILALEDEVNELGVVKLNNLLQLLRRDQGELFKTATTKFLANAADIAAVYMAQELLDLNNTVDFPEDTELKDFTKKALFSRVIRRPLATDGDLLKDFIDNYSRGEINRVSRTIRLGHSQGKTNQEIVREVIGTKARNYRDGILNVSRRHAETMVRTSVQHVASAARQEVWEKNDDVVKRYRFIATLDRQTSKICRSLDRQEFDFGQGPIPPVHPNCRSTTIPILDPKFDFLAKGRTRSSEEGPVAAETSYYDWLKRQDKQTQIEVLGPARTKLFRDGGMTATEFRNLQFDKNFVPLTLEEMREINPEAFKKAGL